jgi:hypothetical protein
MSIFVISFSISLDISSLLSVRQQALTLLISDTTQSPSPNLPLRKRWHPRHNHIKPNNHTPHDPKTLRIVRPMESEQNSKDDAAEIAHSTDSAAQHTVGVWMYVRHQSEVRTIASFKEERHAGDQAKHCRFVLRVEQADGDEEGAGDDADEEDPGFLQPEVGGDVFVEEVADDAS